jgi:hypothetical protein
MPRATAPGVRWGFPVRVVLLVSDLDDMHAQLAIGERIRRLGNDALMAQDDLAAALGSLLI